MEKYGEHEVLSIAQLFPDSHCQLVSRFLGTEWLADVTVKMAAIDVKREVRYPLMPITELDYSEWFLLPTSIWEDRETLAVTITIK